MLESKIINQPRALQHQSDQLSDLYSNSHYIAIFSDRNIHGYSNHIISNGLHKKIAIY